MIKHLPGRTEEELRRITRGKRIEKIIKIVLLAIITSPLAILILIGTIILYPLFNFIFFICVVFAWLRDINCERNIWREKNLWEFTWKFPLTPFFWYIRLIFQIDYEL